MRTRDYTISLFVCPECGNKFPLPRPNSKQRETGHIKDLFCPYCKREQKMREIKHNEFYKTMDGRVLV